LNTHVSADRSRTGVLLGRVRELEVIGTFLDSAAVDGGALLFSGEPGVGKTALLEAAAAEASARGIQILRTAGIEFEAGVSFSGLNQCFLPLIKDLGVLSEEQQGALSVALGLGEGPLPDRLVVSNAALSLLRLAASTRPLLVLIDDLQWVDRPSATTLGFIARRLAGSHIGILAATRSGIESFFDRGGLPEYVLEPLEDEAAAGLVGRNFPSLAPSVRDRVLEEAQGNPLALLELPLVLNEPQRAALRGLPAVLPLSIRLQGLYGSRVRELPEATRDLLLLAVLDGTGDLRLLKAASKADEVLATLAPAEDLQLVRVDRGLRHVAFGHPLIRSAVVELSTGSERRDGHLLLAEQFLDQPERRAWHLAEAAGQPDEEVATLLEYAARRISRRGDATGAVTALTRAADLSPHPSDRSRRLAEAAYVGMTGELRDVSSLLEDARESELDDSGNLYAAAAAAYGLVNGDGDIETAHSILVGAIEGRANRFEEIGEAVADALRALGLICYLGGRAELWTPFHDALACMTPHVPLDLRVVEGTLANPAYATRLALDDLDTGIAQLQNQSDPWRIAAICGGATYVDRLFSCREALWRVVRDGREGETVGQAINALAMLCSGYFHAGAWDESLECAREGAQLCETYGYRIDAWVYWCHEAYVHAARGDQDAADSLSEDVLHWAAPRGVRLAVDSVHHIRGLNALSRGDFEDAYRHVTAISPPGEIASYAPTALWALMDLMEAAVKTRRLDEARAHAAAMHELDIGAISPRLSLVATASAAMVGADESAGSLFEEALAIRGVDSWPFDFARVELAFGEHLRRAKATAESRGHLANAIEIFRRLGARGWEHRATNELRTTGQAKVRDTRLGIDQLTPQEHEIALMAASGMTNREIGEQLFLSHRTVGAHLYRIFPKLGITSRAALRDALTGQPQEDFDGSGA
jgi:DNA-binding CsgD family transcriptional regulator